MLNLTSSSSTQLVLSWDPPDASACNYTYSVSAYPASNPNISVDQSLTGTIGTREAIHYLLFSGHLSRSFKLSFDCAVTLSGLQPYTNYCVSVQTTASLDSMPSYGNLSSNGLVNCFRTQASGKNEHFLAFCQMSRVIKSNITND